MRTGVAGVVGLVGSLACIAAMVLTTFGVIGVGVSGGMAGMGTRGAPETGTLSGILGFLLQAGPTILVISIGLITASLAIRRRIAALPALAGGGIMYWGMYGQAMIPIMDAAVVLGLLIWLATEFWTRRAGRDGDQRSMA